MQVICELHEYSIPKKNPIKVMNTDSGSMVKLEINGEYYVVDPEELISAINRAKLNVFGY